MILPALNKNSFALINTCLNTERKIGSRYGGISITKDDFPSDLIHRLNTFAYQAVTVPIKYITTIIKPCKPKM
ncbi:MAG: hypothetical protein CM1200mP10_24720 [Candidatus Neomarinimicrobiota bacterium]|nr:MAG: hypothetical protein CM1200mP10_24720 [Candidatus Neomarinimicrobiota bacterium]